MSESNTERIGQTARLFRLPAALFVVLAGVLIVDLFSVAPAPPPERVPDDPSVEQSVAVALSTPDAETTEATVAWSDGLTVQRATEAAFPSQWRGEGPMAFLESLHGTPNEGPDGLNWQFEVNGAYATLGAGSVTLEPGDRVLWKLAPYE